MDDQLPPITPVVSGSPSSTPFVPPLNAASPASGIAGPPVPTSVEQVPMPAPSVHETPRLAGPTSGVAEVPLPASPVAAFTPPSLQPMPSSTPPAHARQDGTAFTKKQVLFIIGLGVLGLVLGAGTAYVLNTMGITLIGGQ